MSLFIPDLILKDITKITLQILNENNIKGIILDVDNTLTIHGSQDVEQNVLDWLEFAKQNNIKLMIVSNNTFARVSPFAKKLGIDFVAMGFKPLTFGISRVMKRFDLPAKNIAVVGDQIYTDIAAGNIKKMFTILVSPFEKENGFFFKIKRKLEKRHVKKYYENQMR
ncbi:MAG: YqeG family HAD IIIA-type phosphatase [Oscillospiraceae bacterium]